MIPIMRGREEVSLLKGVANPAKAINIRIPSRIEENTQLNYYDSAWMSAEL